MNFGNKILLSGLVSAAVFSSVCLAEEKKPATETEETSRSGAILFRIENIKPLENTEGTVEKCSFVLTAYNRMDKAVKEADLELQWNDKISGKYIIDGAEVKPVSTKDAVKAITQSVSLYNIAPHIQKSFTFTVDTNKCYLLLDNLVYKVESCATEDDKVVVKNNVQTGKPNSCSDKFDYINSQNPEYYAEFKDKPDSMAEKQDDEAKQEENTRITNLYHDVLLEIEEIGKTIHSVE
jgi:hypothetical protein